MYARINSLGLFGLDGYAVEVEADTAQGLPAFDVVGLPDTAVSESRERVRAAVKNSGFAFPVSRVTVNLAPADKKKTGPIYDLPILLAVLKASGQLDAETDTFAFIGELALDGSLRPVNGALSMAIAARDAGFSALFLPAANAKEAAVAAGIPVFGAAHLHDILDHLTGSRPLTPETPPVFAEGAAHHIADFADVKGQAVARRAMEIAAAGGHNILLIGPPGAGKSMLAKRLPTILPPLTYEQAVETTKIYSVAGALTEDALVTTRPFRSPHHTVSPSGLTGGGTIPRPGEISLAHNGVLFLDELPEFSRQAMEVLRQPIEDDCVTISRVSASLTYPCSVMLVAAMNPCPCGNYGSTTKPCTCSGAAVNRYLSRISGPLLDRLDLHVEVAAVDYDAISDKAPGESSAAIRERVRRARDIQLARYGADGPACNAKLPTAMSSPHCAMTEKGEQTLKRAFDSLGLSARAYDKVLKVARTIADLAGDERIDSFHVAEAVQYRTLDKKYFRR